MKSGMPGGRIKSILRYVLAFFFIVAGVNHFLMPEWYLQNQMPPWIPFPMAVLYVSGIAEILGGIGLLVPQVRLLAAWGLVALLIAVFPGNIHMASMAMRSGGLFGDTIGLLLRLPLQAVFIVAILWVSRESDPRLADAEDQRGS